MSVGTPLRWGFFGCSKITHDFVSGLSLLPVSDHVGIGIGSRCLERATEFAKVHGIPKAFGSYESLLTDPQIDVVYIGTVNSEHFPQAKLAIEHGKHVLCEKPLCLNYKEAKEIVELAREKKLFLMEGFWTRFFPAFKKFREDLERGVIGDLTQTTVITGAAFSHLDRLSKREIGGGSLLNFGVYGIQLALLLFGKPDRIVGSGILSPEGVDETSNFTLYYNNGNSATGITHFKCPMPSEYFAIGTKGFFRFCKPYWAPTVLESPEGRFSFPLPELSNSTNYPNAQGFMYEAEEVRNCIIKGLTESPLMPLDESMAVYEICDEIRRQIGVVYPQD